MIEFEEVWANKLVVFEKARLPLNKYPIMVVRGSNLDRRKVKGGLNSANAVGKSLMLSLIPTIRYLAPPTATKKKSAKEVHSTGSSAGFVFKANGKKYEARQVYKGKILKLELLENDKPIKYREKESVTDRLAELIPQSQQQFYSISYIDVRNNNPLQRGTDAQRFAFFEDLFRLDVFDYVFKELTADYNRLKTEVAQLKTLQQEYSEREADLPKYPLPKLRSLYKRLVKKSKKIQANVERRLRELQHLSVYIALAEGLEGIKLIELDAKIKELREDEAVLQEQYDDSVDYYAKLSTHKKLEKQRQELLEQYVKDRDPFDIKDAENRIVKLVAKASKIEAQISTSKERRAERERVEAKIDALNLNDRWKAKGDQYNYRILRDAIVRKRETIDRLNESKDHLSKNHDATQCPVCLSKLDKKIVKKLIAECDKGIEENIVRLERLQKLADYKSAKEELDDIGEVGNVKQLNSELEKVQDRIAKLRKAIRFETNQRQIKKQLANLPMVSIEKRKVATPDTFKETLKDVRKEIESCLNVRERLVKLERLEKKYDSYEVAKARHDAVQTYVKNNKPVLDAMQDSLQKVSNQLANSESVGKDLERLSAKIADLKQSDADFKIYDALRKAYGAKGLRKLRIRELSKLLEANLNDYAHLVYGEPIQFKLNVTDTKFDVLADRNGKGFSDVRMLSKSESQAFSLLLFRALIPFVPAHKRLNFLVLDEIESGLDDHSKRLFVEEFIPEIQTIVPNIIIVTPASAKIFNVPGAHNVTVQKKNGKSILLGV